MPPLIQLRRSSFRCSADLHWTAERGAVHLEAPGRGLSLTLHYPDTALWDFVVRGIAEDRAAAMLTHIAGFADAVAAVQFMRARLEDWRRQGLIEPQ